MNEYKRPMLQFFRNFFHSRIGVGVTLGLLGIIALAFAAGDVASSGGFGGVAGGDRAATVGKARIGTAALAKQVSEAFDQTRQQNPRLTIKAFLAEGGLEDVLSQVLDRTALTVFGEVHGIIAGKRLVDSELAKVPALQGPDGRFSDTAYRQLLAQRQLTDAEVRDDIATGLVAKQVLLPAQYGAVIPAGIVSQYAGLLRERRDGEYVVLPAAAFAPKTMPSPAELANYYAANRAAFVRPERRVLRYATFDGSALKTVPAPTEAEIAARYNANAAQYAAVQNRRVTQLVVMGEADARAILGEVSKGSSLDAAAKKRGLSAASLGSLSRDALAAQTSPDAAAAAFAAKPGATVGPVKTALGFALLRVDGLDNKPARSLAQAHAEIAAALAVEKRRAALADMTARIEDQFDKGGALTDSAKELGLTLTQTPPITADGQVYGKPGATAPKELAKVVQTAFAMEHEGQPQIAELDAGKTFVMFDVSQIAASAPAPLAEIQGDVAGQLMLQKGAAGARTAALKVLAAVKHGQDLHAAVAALGVALPPVQPLSMTRDKIPTQNGQIPPTLGLFFSMAQGTTKLMPSPNGWLVVRLRSITPGPVAPNDPLLASAATELSQLTGREYADELRAAIRAEVGIKRNEVAIRAVASQLAGGN
jgi:peptidyl-prolyl cis-trans isomerase D